MSISTRLNFENYLFFSTGHFGFMMIETWDSEPRPLGFEDCFICPNKYFHTKHWLSLSFSGWGMANHIARRLIQYHIRRIIVRSRKASKA